MIGAAQFQAVVPEQLKPFFDVLSLDFDDSFAPVLQAFETALACLPGKFHVRRPLTVVISVAPFSIQLTNGALSFIPAGPHIVNVHIEDLLIFIDAVKLRPFELPLIVAAILEEFVHAIGRISDETLVSQVVALLYPRIQFVDGQYVPVP